MTGQCVSFDSGAYYNFDAKNGKKCETTDRNFRDNTYLSSAKSVAILINTNHDIDIAKFRTRNEKN